MSQTKKLRGECQHCGQLIEFEAEAVGTTADCPYCGQPTELMLALPADAGSPTRTKAIIFTIAVLVIVIGGGAGIMLALKRAQRIAAQKKESAATAAPAQTLAKPSDPFAPLGFRTSAPTLEKVDGTSLVYAQGTITNLTNRQRFSVRVELDLLDANGNKLGSATDYCATMEPNSEWRFRAQVLEKKAVSVKIATIKEDK